MTENVSAAHIRQRIGELLDRVALRRDEFIIERKGKPMAALVSVERLEQLTRLARQELRDLLKRQQPSSLTESGAAALAVEAQNWARRAAKRKSRAIGESKRFFERWRTLPDRSIATSIAGAERSVAAFATV
jgi:prevent-host-death family protein